MTPIHGKDVIVFVSNVPVFCGKDCTFSEEKELIEASTARSDHTTVTGPFKEFRLRKQSWTIDVTGLTKIDASDGQLSYFDLIAQDQAMSLQEVSIVFTDVDGNAVEVSGVESYIINSSINGPKNDFSNGSISFLGSGPYAVNGVTS